MQLIIFLFVFFTCKSTDSEFTSFVCSGSLYWMMPLQPDFSVNVLWAACLEDRRHAAAAAC